EDVATEHFGARVSTVRVGQLVRDAHAALAHVDLFAGLANPIAPGFAGSRGNPGEVAVLDVERAGAALFARVRDALSKLGAHDGRVTVPPDLLTARELQEAWFRLDGALEELAQHAATEAEPPPMDDGETDDQRAARE